VSHVHNALHRTTELLQGFKRAMGIDRDADGVERLGETLTPVFDIWSQPEWARLRGEHLGVIELSAVAAAALRSIIGIRNTSTVDEPWLVVVEPGSAAVSSAVQSIMLGSISLTDIGGDTPLQSRDGRRPVGPSFTRGRTDSTAALPAGLTQGQCLRGTNPLGGTGGFEQTMIEVKQPILLRCGQGFYFYPASDDRAVNGMFYTRSRKLFPGEHYLT
jgi:hypothetical protein